MIIPVDDYYCVVILDKKIEYSIFHKAANVIPGSYADGLIKEIYDDLFVYATDLQAQYQNYYKDEYPDFSEFLYWKCQMGDDLIDKILGKMSLCIYVGLCQNTTGILTDEKTLTVLNNLFDRLRGEVK